MTDETHKILWHGATIEEQYASRLLDAERQAATLRARAERAESDLFAAGIRRSELTGELLAAQRQVEKLATALREAIEGIEDWAGYASDYWHQKHDLEGELARLRAVLPDPPPTPARAAQTS